MDLAREPLAARFLELPILQVVRSQRQRQVLLLVKADILPRMMNQL